MPDQKYDTTAEEDVQENGSQDDWTKEVVPRLPIQLEEQARKLKAIEREREVSRASDLLRGLLGYVYVAHSFAHLGMLSVLIGLADVSANAWRKRLRKSSNWLDWLLQELLAMAGATSPWLARGGLKRILLIDGTHWKTFGPQGIVWRVHTAFDLLAGRLTQVKVTDYKEGEHLEVFDLGPGDLVVTDRANGLRERVAFVVSKCAHIIVRITPRMFPMEDEQGNKIVVLDWLKGLHAPDGAVFSRSVWITFARKSFHLRLVALRLSKDQQDKAERRTKHTAERKQQSVHPNTLSFSGWVLVITTLPSQKFSDQQVLRLYQARWHIELLFKRIKQLLKQQSLRCKTAASAKPTITLMLIGWALLEEESASMRLAMRDAVICIQRFKEGKLLLKDLPHASWWQENLCGPLSEWMLAEASFDLFCQQLRGCYTAERFRACLPRLQRFLGSGHRDRPHLFSQVSRWLGQPEDNHQVMAA
jgi:Transposase DDE domain